MPGWAKALISAAVLGALGVSAFAYYLVQGLIAHRGFYRNQGSHFSLQHAVNAHFEEHGRWPKKLTGPGFEGQFIGQIPELDLRELKRGTTREVESYSFTDADGKLLPEKLRDSGRWAYDPKSGVVAIDCKGLNKQKNIPYYLIGQARD